MILTVFPSSDSGADGRTKRLTKKKSWGSRLLKCCSVCSTLEAEPPECLLLAILTTGLSFTQQRDRDTADIAIQAQVSPAVTKLLPRYVFQVRCAAPCCFSSHFFNFSLFSPTVPVWKKSWRTWRIPPCLKRTTWRRLSKGSAGKPSLPSFLQPPLRLLQVPLGIACCAPKQTSRLIFNAVRFNSICAVPPCHF